ncbi:hypothetical protein [Rubellicoccus peritrichatus]|uniref:Tetratricopeptide repeat protein n=1 Tax=Rubellicoccus peritrichatus TaxID=3080537 RepID=A0AAQ3LDB1_9BACT|nr:hypothetical protein [Puniceicoccus sp. CR14]WOO43625.1 hypothetical protein RZN69_11045 [Puniceicoccus sp. CR14]
MRNMVYRKMTFLMRVEIVAFYLLCGALHCISAQGSEMPVLPLNSDRVSNTFKLDTPLRVLGLNNQIQLLRGLQDGQLLLTFPGMEVEAEVMYPISSRDLQLSVILPESYSQTISKIDSGDYQAALVDLEPIAKPLTAFLMISPGRSNFHDVFMRYYSLLVKYGDLPDAVSTSLLMPWSDLSNEYLLNVRYLIYRCIRENDIIALKQLLSLLYANLDEGQFAALAFPVADSLRTINEHELAAMIYGSLASSDDSVIRQRSLLWAGYSQAVSGNTEGARNILDQLGELERSDENYLIYCLAWGRLEYSEGNIRDGLSYLSRAMVLTDVDASFKAELYYLMSIGYRSFGAVDAASRLVSEFEIFYPESPWLEKYRSETLM